MARSLVLWASFALACSEGDGPRRSIDDAGTRLVEEVVTRPASPALPPFDECVVTTARVLEPTAGHVSDCTDLTYDTVPPAHGTHYGSWAQFRDYDSPVPWGFLVHSLEHGALVLARSCDASCPEVLDAFVAVAKALPPDEVCARAGSGVEHRLVTLVDPAQEFPILAAGWGRLYRATCLDLPSLLDFGASAYRGGPEDVCVPGADLAAEGWCP